MGCGRFMVRGRSKRATQHLRDSRHAFWCEISLVGLDESHFKTSDFKCSPCLNVNIPPACCNEIATKCGTIYLIKKMLFPV